MHWLAKGTRQPGWQLTPFYFVTFTVVYFEIGIIETVEWCANKEERDIPVFVDTAPFVKKRKPMIGSKDIAKCIHVISMHFGVEPLVSQAIIKEAVGKIL